MKMSNKTYDALKFVAQVVLPAIATFYLTLGSIWTGVFELPYPEQISATIMAVDTLLGVVLGISSANYKKVQ